MPCAMFPVRAAMFDLTVRPMRWEERQFQQEPGCADCLTASILLQLLSLRLP